MTSDIPITFGERLTIADIDRLHAAADDALVEAWTMQQPGAIERLSRDGELTGDPQFAFGGDPNRKGMPGKRTKYAWMQTQMTKRLKGYQQELPIWVLFTRSTHTDREGDQLLRIEIPKSRVLVSFYRPWVDLSGAMAVLETSVGWPEEWALTVCPYVAVDVDDLFRSIYINGSDGARLTQFDEQVCRLSWERMFDLTLAHRERFLWDDFVLQGMIPRIFHDDVKDVLPIRVGALWS
jgi:Domain of unknown function (DUF3841)